MKHKFQPMPDAADYCKCGSYKHNSCHELDGESKWTPFVGQPVPRPKPCLEQQLRDVAAFAPSDAAAIIEQALSRIAELEAVHADDQQAIALWALYQRKAKQQIQKLETELAESIAMWKGSLEIQGELEQKVARQAITIHERQQSWQQMKEQLEQQLQIFCDCECPHCQSCEKKS